MLIPKRLTFLTKDISAKTKTILCNLTATSCIIFGNFYALEVLTVLSSIITST